MSVEVSRTGAAARIRKDLGASRIAENADVGSAVVAGLILIMVFLQKLAVPVSATVPLSLPLLAVYGGIAIMVVRLQLKIAPVRLAAFGMLLTGLFISQLTAIGNPAPLSMLQFLIIYLPLIFVWPVTEERYLRTLNVYQNAMLIIVPIVAIQQVSQIVFGQGQSPNMELYVPPKLLLPDYNYAGALHFGSAFVRPNGFFFLEPSFASSFLASALVIELVFFRRLWRIAAYAAALLGTMAATGLVLLALSAPFLIPRLPPRMLIAAGVMGILALVVAGSAGLLDALFGRFSELSGPGSSGFERLVAPLLKLNKLATDSRFIFTGAGAGTSVEKGSSTWPMVKVMMEYGAISSIAFVVLLIVCSVKSANRALAFGFLMVFNFTGGYLVCPPSVIQLWLLITMMAPLPPNGPSLLAAPPWNIGVRRQRREKLSA